MAKNVPALVVVCLTYFFATAFSIKHSDSLQKLKINMAEWQVWLSIAVWLASIGVGIAGSAMIDHSASLGVFAAAHIAYPISWMLGYVYQVVSVNKNFSIESNSVQAGIMAQFASQFAATAAALTWMVPMKESVPGPTVVVMLQCCILVYSATCDGVFYVLPMLPKSSSQRNKNAAKVHAVCAAFHLTSSLVLLVYGLSSESTATAQISAKFWSFLPWQQSCYDEGEGRYVDDVDNCDEAQTVFSLLPATNPAYTVNLLALATSYTTVSGMAHAIVFMRWIGSATASEMKRETKWRFWADYAISAPTMLAAMNIVFGANGLMAVVVSPLLLCLLLVLSPCLLFPSLLPTVPTDSCATAVKWACFACMIVLYGACLAPSVAAVTQSGAPPWVKLMLWSMIALFSAFIVPFAWEMRMQQQNKKTSTAPFYLWAFMSLNTKVVLHCFFAVSIFQQGMLVDNYDMVQQNAAPTGTSMPSLAQVGLILGLVPTSGIVVLSLLKYYFVYRVEILVNQ